MRSKGDREDYLSQPIEVITGSPDKPEYCIRRFCDSGVYFRTMSIESGKGGDPVEIVQITDMHFNMCDETDENNPELMLTKQFRKWNAGGVSVKSADKAMEFAKLFDLTVITGDTLDYLSNGAVELMRKHIWGADPNAIACLGGHELTRQMQTGKPDETPLAERQAYLAKVWNHDIYYHSEVLGGKVMIIALDNSCACYWDCQVPKLEADITRAKQEGLVVLIFQHEPLSTGKAEDSAVETFFKCDKNTADFYSGAYIGSVSRVMTGATERIYNMITENADIVRGVFCGHVHSAFYTELNGSYKDSSTSTHTKTIPQVALEGNVYNNQAGHVMRITVK